MTDPLAEFKTEYKKRIARQKRSVLRFLLLFCVLAVACGAVIGASYLFRIRSVEITGNERCATEEIRAWTNIRIGAPLSSVNREKTAEELTDSSVWIRNAEVVCDVFGRVKIRVTEYTPEYTVLADNGAFIVSKEFMTLERAGERETTSGLTVRLQAGKDAVIGEFCSVRGEETTAASRIAQATRDAQGLPAITGMDLSVGYYYKLNCEHGITVILGNTDSLPLKLELAAAMLSQNAGKNWSHAEINVSDIKKTTFRILD